MIDKNMQFAGWKNYITGETRISRKESYADAQPLAFSGIQLIQPELLDMITEECKFPIIDLYLRLAISQSIIAYHDQSELWMDLGKPEQLQAAEMLFRKC